MILELGRYHMICIQRSASCQRLIFIKNIFLIKNSIIFSSVLTGCCAEPTTVVLSPLTLRLEWLHWMLLTCPAWPAVDSMPVISLASFQRSGSPRDWKRSWGWWGWWGSRGGWTGGSRYQSLLSEAGENWRSASLTVSLPPAEWSRWCGSCWCSASGSSSRCWTLETRWSLSSGLTAQWCPNVPEI